MVGVEQSEMWCDEVIFDGNRGNREKYYGGWLSQGGGGRGEYVYGRRRKVELCLWSDQDFVSYNFILIISLYVFIFFFRVIIWSLYVFIINRFLVQFVGEKMYLYELRYCYLIYSLEFICMYYKSFRVLDIRISENNGCDVVIYLLKEIGNLIYLVIRCFNFF